MVPLRKVIDIAGVGVTMLIVPCRLRMIRAN